MAVFYNTVEYFQQTQFISTINMTSGSEVNAESPHCGRGDLLGVLGLFVQALLAFLAFTSLIGE